MKPQSQHEEIRHAPKNYGQAEQAGSTERGRPGPLCLCANDARNFGTHGIWHFTFIKGLHVKLWEECSSRISHHPRRASKGGYATQQHRVKLISPQHSRALAARRFSMRRKGKWWRWAEGNVRGRRGAHTGHTHPAGRGGSGVSIPDVTHQSSDTANEALPSLLHSGGT